MSYQVLARKWRPKSFEELVGQKQTAKALINALETQRLHHAYLFSGTRGVGKTTIARILSKSLNCEQGITSKPCGECSSCVEIDQGNFVDLMEIDAASKTKVEDTRELLDNVQYRPTRGRYKVYLIDEVHMLSGHSFNALLKTLEEPPPHVIFLLATTDPQKLPVTVLSRCLQFNLKRMEEAEIIHHLDMILTAEQIQFDREALSPIAKGADGSMRDALSLLDQAIAYCGDKLELAAVLEMLGSIDQSYCFQLLDAIQNNNATQLMTVIQQMSQYSPDYFEVMSDWLNLLHRIAVTQATGSTEDEQISQLAESISAADLQLYYQLSLQAKKDLPFAPHPRQGFEMALLRVLAFRPKKSPTPTNLPDPNRPVTTPNHPVTTNSTSATQSVNTQSEQAKKKVVQSTADVAAISANTSPCKTSRSNTSENTARKIQSEPTINQAQEQNQAPAQEQNQASRVESRIRLVADNTTKIEHPSGLSAKTAEPPVEYQQNQVSAQFNNNTADDAEIEYKGLYPDAKAISLENTSFDNWHYLVDQMNIEANGLQVLLNSLGTYKDNILNINHLDKVSHLLTANLQGSLVSQIKQHFADEKSNSFAVEFIAAKELAETPKEKQIKLYQANIDIAYQQLTDDPCVSKLQQVLNVDLDRQSIRLNVGKNKSLKSV